MEIIPGKLDARLRLALEEDEAKSDVTTELVRKGGPSRISAVVIAKESGVFCGQFLAKPLFRLLDPDLRVKTLVTDGKSVKRGQKLVFLSGKIAAILGGERVYLNLASHLSGIASRTHQYVAAVRGTTAKIFDTRKTTPLWRDIERIAVRCGGGHNHRWSLKTAILVKDNHHQLLRKSGFGLTDVFELAALKKMRSSLDFASIEAATLDQVWEALRCDPEIILLDNMSLPQCRKAISVIKAARRALRKSTPLIEVSGGITLQNIRSYALLGPDRISVGAITHSAPSLNMSLEVLNGRV